MQIAIESPDLSPRRVERSGTTVVVGRDPDCDLVLRFEDGVSRKHCRFTVEGGQVFVEDIGSTNGTFVNGVRLGGKSVVEPEDVILAGKVALRVRAGSEDVAPRAARPEPPARRDSPTTKAQAPRAGGAVASPPRGGEYDAENEACRAELDPLARGWRDLGKPAWALLHGVQLERGLRWMKTPPRLEPRPGDLHREFILASRTQRRGRARALGFGLAAATATIVASVAVASTLHGDLVLPSRDRAAQPAAQTRCDPPSPEAQRSAELATRAAAAKDPELALLLAARALELAPQPCARLGAAEAVARELLAARSDRVLARQAAAFRSVDVTSDDRVVVAVDDAGALGLWELSSGTMSRPLPTDGGLARVAAVGPAGVLAVGSENGRITVWNLDRPGAPIRSHDLAPHEVAITALGFSPDGRFLATGDRGGRVRLWDLRRERSGAPILELGDHDGPITHVVLDRGARHLLSVGGEVLAREIRGGAATGGPRSLADGDEITALAVDEASEEVFLGTRDGKVLRSLFGASTVEQVVTHDEAVVGLALLGGSRVLVSVGRDRQVRVTELDKKMRDDGSRLSVGLKGLQAEPLAVAVEPTGRRLVVAASDARLYVWDITQRFTAASPVAVHEAGRVRDLAASHDGNWLYTVGDDGTLRQWVLQGAAGGVGSATAADHLGPIFDLALGGEGTRLLTTGKDRQIRSWGIGPGGKLRLQAAIELEAPAQVVALSSDGRWAAMGVGRGTEVWDLAAIHASRKAPPIVLPRHVQPLRFIGFTGDDGWMITADDTEVRTWRMREDGPESSPARTEPIEAPITGLAIAPTEPLLAAGGYDGQVFVLRVDGGAPVQRVGPLGGAVLTLAFGPESEYLAVGGEDTRALLLRLDGGRVTPDANYPALPHDRFVPAMAFDPARRWLATGSDNGAIRIWRLGERKERQLDLTGHEAGVVALAFDPAGEVLLSAGRDGTLRLWRAGDFAGGGAVGSITLRAHDGPVTAMRVDTKGDHVVTAGEDGVIHVWPLAPARLVAFVCGATGEGPSEQEWRARFPGEPYVPACAGG